MFTRFDIFTVICFNPFPHTNISAADVFEKCLLKIWKVSIILVFLLKQVENIVAKGKIARFEQFFFLSLCFQMSSAAISSKCVCRWERVKNIRGKMIHVSESKNKRFHLELGENAYV